MKRFFSSCFIISISLFSCKSSVKQQTDSIYSRHLQRHLDLTIISTPIPDRKEEMNLLLFANSEFLETIRAKKLIDSLYKKKLIQPVTLVAFRGESADYGLEEIGADKANQYRKFNKFVSDELYPFCKKKAVIRKFNSVAICGFGASALSAFDIAFNNDDKIQSAGMFYPEFNEGLNNTDTIVLQTIQSLRKRPRIKIFLLTSEKDSMAHKFNDIISEKHKDSECELITTPGGNKGIISLSSSAMFGSFLLRAFGR